MGSNSNRSETRSETLNRFANNVRSGKTSDSNWQISKGAEIRGKLGVEKGNQFISDMKKYK
jgi:hypothetical protein